LKNEHLETIGLMGWIIGDCQFFLPVVRDLEANQWGGIDNDPTFGVERPVSRAGGLHPTPFRSKLSKC
jgi:hypothetical protein